MRFRRLPFCILIVSILIPLAGCWSGEELNDRSFARIMMLDQSDGKIQMTLGFPLPNRMAGQVGSSGGGGGGSAPEPFTYVTKTGLSLGDAYRQIQADMPRKITFGQLRHVVIGRTYAEKGLETFVDFMARIPHIHINANLFVTEGNVQQFTKIPVAFERFPTDILTRYAKDEVTVTVTIKDLLVSLYHGGDFIVPMLVFGHEGAVKEKNAEHWVGTNGAVLMQKGRLAGLLNAKETRGAMWIMGELQDAEFDVESPTDGKNISFIVDRTNTSIRSKVNGNRIRIRINCKGNARVISNNSNVDLSDDRQLRQVEQSLERELEDRINFAVGKAKQARADVFQLGRYVEWRYPRQWKGFEAGWRQRFATEVEIDPQVDIRVKWFGGVRKPEWNRIFPNTEGS